MTPSAPSSPRSWPLAGATGTVIFGGDVNRRPSCAPQGFWTLTDRSARQDPGSQQVYGNAGLRAPSARVVPAVHTDHDILLVRANPQGDDRGSLALPERPRIT